MTQLALQGEDLLHTGGIDMTDGEPSRFAHLTSRITRPVQSLRAVPHVGTWSGVLLCSVGLVLLVVAWGRTAALTNVGLQIPYVVSAGFTGLGLVVVGVTVVSYSAKRADSLERSRQLEELRELLSELRSAVEGDER